MYYNYNHYPYPPYNNTTPKYVSGKLLFITYPYPYYPSVIHQSIICHYQHLASELTPNNRRHPHGTIHETQEDSEAAERSSKTDKVLKPLMERATSKYLSKR